MSLAVNGFYRFGEFTLDRQQKVLLRNGSPLPLAPKVFDTLLILIDNNGRIVEKKELMSRLWPDTFVEDSNLTFNIQQLRKALGDNARQPRFIETVARRGYRFIAEVNGNSPPPDSAKTEWVSAGSSQTLPALKRSYLPISALVVMLIGALAIIGWFGQRRLATSASSVPILSRQFKSEKFAAAGLLDAAITPDGKFVAYTSETGGKQSIWLRQLETSENIQIVPPTDERYLGLVVSHDGNSLYFVRTLTEHHTTAIYSVMTFGGIPTKITEQTMGTVSVSPDDKQVSFIRCNYQDDDFCSLYVIGADGKNERKLLARQRPLRLAGAQFSPDGKSIAFASGQSSNGGSDFRLMRVDLASGTESVLTSRSFFNIRNLKWLPDGWELLFTASESLDASFRIWHVSAATGETRAVTKDASDYSSLSLTQTADKMIASFISNTFHLYLARIDAVNNPKNLTVARTGLAFSPDGKIVYEGNDGDIWTINSNGAEQRQLTNDALKDFLPRVSPDARFVFFTSNRSGSNQIWRMNIDGSNQVQITREEGGYPRFVTSDGKWVYFESGLHRNLWRVPADGGQESQVLEGPLYETTISPDGNWIAYLFRANGDKIRFTLAVKSLSDPKYRKIFQPADSRLRTLCVAWGPDNNAFFYVTSDGSRNSLWRQSLSHAEPVLIGDLGDDEVAHLAVSADGTSIAFIRGRWVNDAVLIEGLK